MMSFYLFKIVESLEWLLWWKAGWMWSSTLRDWGPGFRLVHAQVSTGLNNLSQAMSNTEAGNGRLATQDDLGCMCSESGLSNWGAHGNPLWILRAYCLPLLPMSCSVISHELLEIHQGNWQMLLITFSLSPRAIIKHLSTHHQHSPAPRASDSVDLGWSSRICISHKFPGAAAAAELRSTH